MMTQALAWLPRLETSSQSLSSLRSSSSSSAAAASSSASALSSTRDGPLEKLKDVDLDRKIGLKL